ncbi:hypothetical protein [Streptomyces gobiensis]|uniref:hypothetical protein n=1 Tax=Streptomyces gobiensis TaxID=2875706 RepID=UPI001E286E37|nr:hypothetical protein [Streptomyces gobiensis]UGY92806.1 hypothetical protein test1122_14520 [Streptomyces gobiensis]
MKASKRIAMALTTATVFGGLALAPAASADNTAPRAQPSTQTHSQTVTSKGRCGGHLVATAVKYSYSTSSCSVAGHAGYKLGIKWTATDRYTALQVRGYGKNGKAKWYNCGSGGGKCTVPWGNRLGKPKVRGWNAVRPATVYFSH